MKKQNSNHKLKIVILALAVVLVAAVGVLIYLSATPKQPDVPTETTVPAVTEATVPEETVPEESVEVTEPVETIPDTPDVEISTPYGTLYYPGEWEELLQVEQIAGDIYDVKFFSKLDDQTLVELFTISFGGENGYGYVKANDGQTVAVNVKTAEIQVQDSWTSSQNTIVFTMQEALNQVLSKIEFIVPDAAVEPIVIPEDESPSDLETPYGKLQYPARWDQYLVTKVDEKDPYSIRFSAKIGSHEQMHLFTVYFGGDKGVEAGTVGGKTLRLEIAEHELDGSWSEKDRLLLLAMQEDMNYLLNNLPQ